MKNNKKELKKITKKGIAVLLAGTMIGTMFAGCSNNHRKSLLEGTILEGAQVMTTDEDSIIVTPKYEFTDKGECRNGKHYRDVVSGTIYHVSNFTTEEAHLIMENSQKGNVDSNEESEKIVFQTIGDIKRTYNCANVNAVYLFEDEVQLSAITNKLTDEELKKAQEGNFTDEDAIELEKRILSESKTLG